LVAVNLSAYLDNELDPDQSDMITAHLESCAACADLLDAMEETDEEIQREWREDSPLPSSSQFRQSVDAIMDALPAELVAEPVFAPKRVHARTRWVRFATGMSGFILVAGMLWSSYRIGYVQGRQNAGKSAFTPVNPTGYNPAVQPMMSVASLSPASAKPPEEPLPFTFARERRFHR
jgi:anti-sigma factor RsiW